NVLYFTNWGIYGADFQPQQIPAANVTHLLYSFLDIATDGTVISSDTWSDIEKRYSTDSWSEPGYNVYGCVKQLYVLKKKYRKFKTLLSIGGWTYSSKFAPVAANPTKRKKFVASAVKLLADWGFDGVDVDWEYPSTASDANNYVLLLKELRAGLDDYAAKNNMKYRFIITVASAAGPAQYGVMNLKGMNPYVDAWHLMAYDYSGPWDRVTGHQANLYPSQANLMSSPYNTNKAVADYMAQGISASKIVMGMPLYGRSFAKTTGPGKPYTGVGGGSTVGQTTTPGIWLYKDLPRPGAQVTINSQAVGVWSFDAVSKEYVTYDNIHTARIKANYITNKNLGGAMYWEASGDKTGVDSIVKTVANQFGTLDTTQNMLWYPTSAYANMRAGMPS
ncbi:glycoside hydrolase superfamily, partial [Dactylonectria estremocensis]